MAKLRNSADIFECTNCPRTCNHTTTRLNYMGREIIGENEALCKWCVTDRKKAMKELMTMSKQERQELLGLL